jgi:ATP-binding cassette subfamily B (MDR/TAP) protein 1
VPTLDQLDPKVPLIEFRNASFSYPTRPSVPVLRSINLKIYSGQFVALVGSSGSGKSTIVQLLERFYDLKSGEILIGGISVNKLCNEDVRKLFSLVSQEPTLYSGSIAYNAALGIDSILLPEKLSQLLEQAQLSEFVASLPEGINTEVGSRGASLSGGQKQRVAIARALAQASPILLLDEATSALDSESELKIQRTMISSSKLGDASSVEESSKTGGKTVVAIAHRLSTIQHADNIFVFDKGQIVEAGSHDELMNRSGLYWSMCTAQVGLVD